MNTPQYIPSFYFYKFAQGISAPYTELAAYSAGAIDSSGNVLKAESSIDSFEYLIIKLKKIFEQLPAGLTKAQLTNYLSTLQLFSEAVQAYDISDAQFAGLVEGYIALNKNPNTSYIALCEDMGVGGGGGGAGTISTPVVSNNQGGVGGFDPVMAPMQRRKPPVGLDNCEMFDVCAEEMGQFKLAKAWKHLPASETKTYLQRYQARNPKGKIALRSIDPDTGKQDIHWVDYSKQSFAEEYDLGFLDILNEKIDLEEPISKLVDPILNPPAGDKLVKGAPIERVGKLVHGVRALGRAVKDGSTSLTREISKQLIDLAGKSISNNKKDAIDLDQKGNIVPLDVKGHNTTIADRVDVGEYSSHPGLEDVIRPLQNTIRDTEAPPEYIEAASKKARAGLRQLDIDNKDLIRDTAMANVSNTDVSVFPGGGGKPFVLPHAPTLITPDTLKDFVSQSGARYDLRTNKQRAEVFTRVRDISSKTAAGSLQTISQNLHNRELESAQIDPNIRDVVLQNLHPRLANTVRQLLSPYTKK